MNIVFEPVETHEADRLEAVARELFIKSFDGTTEDPDSIEDYVNKAYEVEVLEEEIQDEESFTYWVKADDTIAGYFKLNIGQNQTELYGDEYLELQRIYIFEDFKRLGIGSRILDFTKKKAQELQKEKIWLGVWEHNHSAQKFYEKNGFERDGHHIFWMGDERQVDYIMTHTL